MESTVITAFILRAESGQFLSYRFNCLRKTRKMPKTEVVAA